MGRINVDDLEHYVKENKGTQQKEKKAFFSLKNNGDVAQVRFCHNEMSDVELVTLHAVKGDDGITRKVACLRDYNDPIDKCPFCKYVADGRKERYITATQAKFFLSLVEYQKDTLGNVSYTKKLWERGPQFKKELDGLMRRYNPLCKQVFEIERQGEPGDTSTKYGLYPIPGGLEDFPLTKADLENTSVVGTAVANRTAEDINYFIENGTFLRKQNTQQQAQPIQATPQEQPAFTTTEGDTQSTIRRRL